MAPSFGAIKLVMQRCPGAERKLCKSALESNGDDVDKAAKFINDTTEFKDVNAPPEHSKSSSGGNLSLADHEAGRACIEIIEERTTVTVIRMEEGDRETFPS